MLESRSDHLPLYTQVYFHIGIIDYLSTWTTIKKLERDFKLMKNAGDPSSADPELYANRFAKFMKNNFHFEKSIYNVGNCQNFQKQI